MNQKQYIRQLENDLAKSQRALAALTDGVIDLKVHMLTSKFHVDTSIQVSDVNRYLNEAAAASRNALDNCADAIPVWQVEHVGTYGRHTVVSRHLSIEEADEHAQRLFRARSKHAYKMNHYYEVSRAPEYV